MGITVVFVGVFAVSGDGAGTGLGLRLRVNDSHDARHGWVVWGFEHARVKRTCQNEGKRVKMNR